MTDTWKEILKFYEKELDIPRNVTEFLAVLEILKGCAMGLSNNRIAKGYDDVDYVAITLINYFNFPGWEYDLDFSPLAIYKRNNGNYLAYEQEITMISNEDFNGNIKISYNICKKYIKVKEEIDKYYG
jgi:hypothetical protein